MPLTITARHFTLEDELKEYIESKCVKLRRFYDGIIGLEVVLGWEKLERYAEFRINVYNRQIIIKETSGEIRKSFDLALEKALRQIKRYKNKIHKIEKRRAAFVEEEIATEINW